MKFRNVKLDDKEIKDWKCEKCGKLLDGKSMFREESVLHTRITKSCSCGHLNILMKKK